MCKDGQLEFRDYCSRIVRQEGGDSEWIRIPRYRCNNPGCRKLHRILPDILVPYKHYQEEVIADSLDGRISPSDSDDRPSEQTVKNWNHWLMFNALNIDGHMNGFLRGTAEIRCLIAGIIKTFHSRKMAESHSPYHL